MNKSKLYLITFLLAFSSSILISQKATTEDEYNYMIKGYKTQIENGYDMKKGYAINDSLSYDVVIGNYIFEFRALYRIHDKSIVGHIVKAISKSWGNTYWYGIPIGSKELFDKFFASMSSLDFYMTIAFFEAYYQYTMIYTLHDTNENTSDIEYNYMSKGYQTQKELGLDMKKGYLLIDEAHQQYLINNYEIDFLPLVRQKDKTIVGLITTVKNEYIKPLHIGIPYSLEKDMCKKFFKEVSTNTESLVTVLFGAYICYTNNILFYQPVPAPVQ